MKKEVAQKVTIPFIRALTTGMDQRGLSVSLELVQNPKVSPDKLCFSKYYVSTVTEQGSLSVSKIF